ncbi:MAG TPA: CusA/CzcA family heavy metal efflux RND transporter [Bacteroidota bacterium]|nr:CusA/CzcA family heavy metal efflux RND transporter [Bacteroidota bacterium]
MIRALLHFALNQRPGTLVLAGVIIALGIWSWSTLKKVAYPDIGDTQVTVITVFPGRAAEEVEQQITIPIEKALNAVPYVISRRSKTIFGLSVLELTFEDGVDDYFARQRVLEKLSDAVLPDGVSPSLGPLTGPVDEIFRYVIEAPENYTPMDLRTLQDWVVIPKLLQAPGVADVINFGGLVKQFHVITSPDKLLRYHLTLQNLIDAITSNNLNTGGNIIRRGGQGFVVRGVGAIRSRTDIENIVVTAVNGVPIFVRNLAVVEQYPLPPSGILGYTLAAGDSGYIDVASSIQGLVAMRRGENPSDVVTGLEERVRDINENDLPEGVRLRITYNRSELVDNTIETVSHTLFEGISIVIIVLIFFIGSPRAALVVATTIPVSMLFAFVMMKLTGIPASLLSLGAIDFGIIVDGAVVMVENIMRRYREITPEERRRGIIPLTLEAAQEVGREIFFSIAIIILAYLPIFTFQRVEGKLFSPMAYTLGFAITGSMILALTVIPVLMTLLFRRYFTAAAPGPLEWHNPLYGWLEARYRAIIGYLTARNGFTVAVSMAIVAVAIAAGARSIGTEFLPDLDEGSINIRCFFPVGISLDESGRYMKSIRRVIAGYPAVKTVITQLGRNDDGTDPYGPNRCEILVGLRPYREWTGSMSKRELLERVKHDLEQSVPGALFSFSQPILDNVTEAVTGSVADLAILINGTDLGLMRLKADSILAVVRTIPGATEFGIEQENNQAQLSVDIDRQAAARYGINVSDIQKMIEAAIGGKPVSTLYDGNRRFDIVVRYESEYRATIDAVKNLLVPSAAGAYIPMYQLAQVKLMDGPTIIQREDGRRQISVRTNIRGRDQGSFVREAQEKVAGAVTLPKGYDLEWGGQFENLSRAASRMAVVIPITLAIILVILSILFRNIRHVIAAMSCIPFALTGGIGALLLRGYNFNVSSGVGFVSLFGISTLLGVLFVSRVNRLRGDYGLETREAVLRAAMIQLRPGMMTILLALLGLIPAALASGIGSDVQRPLATVIVGGLLSKLVLTLLVLPSVYLLLEEGFRPGRKKDAGSAQEGNPG